MDKENVIYIKQYSAIKEKMLSFATTWRNTGHYAKENKPEKNKYCIVPLICKIKKKHFKANFVETWNKMVIFMD